jgi:hypothetical protein
LKPEPDNAIVVVKARHYRLSRDMLDALASEWEGYPCELTGGVDDIHYEFRLSAHADGFKKSIKAFKLQ